MQTSYIAARILKRRNLATLACLFTSALLSQPGLFGQVVKITPLGSKTGELCFLDRAMVLEDPTGIRILYDPGVTVAGSTDPRLGSIHVALLSHLHFDHIGDARLNQDPDAANAICGSSFPTTPVVPNSNLAEIVGAKNAAFIGMGGDVTFLSKRIAGLAGICGGNPFSSAAIQVPTPGPCVSPLFYGGTRTVTMAGASAGIQISIVTAKHDNAVPADLLTGTLSTDFAAQGLVSEPGDPVGYVITFTNGLTVYLSGDTGETADMSEVVRKEYHAQLAVLNIGDIFTAGPKQAAYAVNSLIQPESVIPSHVNEVATSNGVVISGTKTAQFIRLAQARVYVPLSGRTMQFDQHGRCTGGCN
jgi:L-ascorbate metabolism protein UlaG (beta-lactamase superfamily)